MIFLLFFVETSLCFVTKTLLCHNFGKGNLLNEGGAEIIRTNLLALGLFGTVDTVNCSSTTPTVTFLSVLISTICGLALPFVMRFLF